MEFIQPIRKTIQPLSKEDALEIGFKSLHASSFKSLSYDLGRKKSLSIRGIGTPNEMVWLLQTSKNVDIIPIHNWEYNGFLSKDKLEGLIKLLK